LGSCENNAANLPGSCDLCQGLRICKLYGTNLPCGRHSRQRLSKRCADRANCACCKVAGNADRGGRTNSSDIASGDRAVFLNRSIGQYIANVACSGVSGNRGRAALCKSYGANSSGCKIARERSRARLCEINRADSACGKVSGESCRSVFGNADCTDRTGGRISRNCNGARLGEIYSSNRAGGKVAGNCKGTIFGKSNRSYRASGGVAGDGGGPVFGETDVTDKADPLDGRNWR
jgi:hypothetical protein